jgi:uncharacterized protein
MENSVLIFTRTAGYRHESIPAGVAALTELASSVGLDATATQDPDEFTPQRLGSCAAVVFLSTTDSVLTDAARDSLERYVLDGGGFLGIHSAAGTEFDWPFYGDLIGARFTSHPPLQSAVVAVADSGHPATVRLPKRWQWTDEWYDFHALPVPGSRILAVVDESLYQGSTMGVGSEHPLVWCRDVGQGRSFYTALGHQVQAYADPDFRGHLLGALRWAGRWDGS